MSHEIRRFIDASHRHPSWPRIYCLGDSWFQYPVKSIDLQKRIERGLRRQALFFNNSVPGRESAAIKALLPRLREQLGAWQFDVLLLSMGGNDIVGDELAEFVKHPDEPQSPDTEWPTAVPNLVRRHIRLRAFARALNFVVDDLARVIELRNNVAPGCAVLINSYDYPFASGRPYRIGPIRLGPWLKPHFSAVGLADPVDQYKVASWLIDQFVAAASKLARAHTRVAVVDGRGCLPASGDWGNEIHPNERGFRRLAEQHWLPRIRAELGLA